MAARLAGLPIQAVAHQAVDFQRKRPETGYVPTR
jgi:hypothetical protein